jgi:cytochrome c oxidase subunit 4
MASTKTYAAIFGLLMVFSTTQAVLEFAGILEEYYWIGLAVIMVLSTIKAVLVAGWFQHLRHEPRSVTYLMLGSLVIVLALTAGAAYSIL